MQNISEKIFKKYIKEKEYLRNVFCQNSLYQSGIKNIMIIDDCQDTLIALRKYLSKNSNFLISVYSDEYEAFERFSKERPDLVILDVNLENLNGIRFSSVLETLTIFKLPILLISQDKCQIEHVLEMGRTETSFLSKPIKQDALLSEVKHIFNHDI